MFPHTESVSEAQTIRKDFHIYETRCCIFVPVNSIDIGTRDPQVCTGHIDSPFAITLSRDIRQFVDSAVKFSWLFGCRREA